MRSDVTPPPPPRVATPPRSVRARARVRDPHPDPDPNPNPNPNPNQVHSDLIGVLTDGANAPHVEAALRVLLQGCTEGPDLQLQRQCFLILHRLVEEWCGGGPAAVPGFGVFALQQALHCTLLHHTALYYAILYHTTLYYTILYRTLLYSALLCSTLLYSALPLLYSDLLSSTLQLIQYV